MSVCVCVYMCVCAHDHATTFLSRDLSWAWSHKTLLPSFDSPFGAFWHCAAPPLSLDGSPVLIVPLLGLAMLEHAA